MSCSPKIGWKILSKPQTKSVDCAMRIVGAGEGQVGEFSAGVSLWLHVSGYQGVHSESILTRHFAGSNNSLHLREGHAGLALVQVIAGFRKEAIPHPFSCDRGLMCVCDLLAYQWQDISVIDSNEPTNKILPSGDANSPGPLSGKRRSSV